jgi:GntR family transcriptional regulator, vanillate catabolism transcriptional regulator
MHCEVGNRLDKVYSLGGKETALGMTDQSDLPTLETAGGSRAGNRALSVMDLIREAILGGSVAAGERLNEVQLGKTMAVSRTPVRAALQALAGEGLLDYAPNRGFTVREFPLDAIVDAYDIRASLEGVAARFAAERGLRPEEKALIERSLIAGDKLLERGSFEAGDLTIYRGINGDFHDTLLAAARNRMLGEMIRICHHVPVSSSRNIVAFEHRDVRRRHDDHHRIYEAVIAQEPWRAEMLMREHVSSIKTSLIRSLSERQADHRGEMRPAGEQLT